MTHPLRDLIDAVTPPLPDGAIVGLPLGPHAAEWVASTPTIIHGAAPAPPRAIPIPIRRVPRKKLRVVLMHLLEERPGSTIFDLVGLARRRGVKFVGVTPRNTVEVVLKGLEADGFVRRVQLSPRDEKAHGARYLWEAA